MLTKQSDGLHNVLIPSLDACWKLFVWLLYHAVVHSQIFVGYTPELQVQITLILSNRQLVVAFHRQVSRDTITQI
jgi:hypothetical protein